MMNAKFSKNSDGSSPASSGGSAVSWEVLSESQDRMVLWVPDHHVTHCTSCHREFWIALRKHHCRFVYHCAVSYLLYHVQRSKLFFLIYLYCALTLPSGRVVKSSATTAQTTVFHAPNKI